MEFYERSYIVVRFSEHSLGELWPLPSGKKLIV